MLDTELIGGGLSAGQANAIQGSIAPTVAAAGNSLATGTVITTAISGVSSGTGGVTLPTWANTGDLFSVYNLTGSSITVYPSTSSGKINGGNAGAGVTVSANKGGKFRLLDNGVNWGAVYS